MKTNIFLRGVFLLLLMSWSFTQCQQENEEIIPVKGPDPVVHGDALINCTDCAPLAANGASADFNADAVPAGAYYLDKAHSNVMWETHYKIFGSLLTGRFNYFVLKSLNFDEANPANISFEGYVRLNAVNTGEPGRDGGCLLSTFGTQAGLTTEDANIATLKSVANSGSYSTTDEGFVADADFTFHGVTRKVTVKLFFYPVSDQGTTMMTGLSAEFEFNALTDYLITSTNIDDKVKIRINTLLRNKK